MIEDDGIRIATASPAKLLERPAYRQIIGLGPRALPLMLRDLREHGRFWSRHSPRSVVRIRYRTTPSATLRA